MTGEVLRGEVVDLSGDGPRSPGAGAQSAAPAGAPRRLGPRPRWLAVAVAAVLVLIVGVVLISRRSGDEEGPGATAPLAQAEAQTFLAAWSTGDTVKMQGLVSDPGTDVARDLSTMTSGLHIASADYTFVSVADMADPVPNAFGTAPGTTRSVPTSAPDRVVTFEAKVLLTGLGPWAYQGSLPLMSTPAGYRVAWSPAVIHPALRSGLKLDRTRSQPDRGPILGADDQPLVAPRPTVTVGLWPAHVKDRAQVKSVLAAALQVDPASIDRKLDAPGIKPDQLIAVITISKEAYNKIRAQIHDIPGLNFPEGTTRSAPTPGFATQLLGRTGEITAEQLAKAGPLFQQGDIVGMSGLEAQYQSALGGTPSGDIRVLDATGAPVQVLQHVAGAAPQPLHTTIDSQTQEAAENALAGVTQPGAFVAVDKEGHVRAAVSLPLTEDFNRALLGQYPPGSTFKVVTSDALLGNGVTPSSATTCPATLTVDGKTFHNAEAENHAQLPLSDAFAQSCNTAFIAAAQKLPPDALAAAAATFGFDTATDLGVKSAGGTFPKPNDGVAAAAAAIGQGQVVTSPVQMASVAATVMVGQWHAPVLVTAPPGVANDRVSTPAPSAAPAALDPATRSSLDSMMHLVVKQGTGTKAAVKGKDIAGKTGTAEFGTANPPQTHAWFVGYNGTVAIAVIIEGGGFGGDVAAPIAAKFFAG